MKRIFTAFACTFAVGAVSVAQPRSGVPAGVPQADTVLLSAEIDGTCLVRRYLVKQRCNLDSDYAMRYRIDVAQLSATLAGNARQLSELQAFIDRIAQGDSLEVTGISITGYASPDGSYAPNERLARKRAADFRNYVDSKYGLSSRYPISVSAVVDEWRSAVPAVETSAIPAKEEVLRILESDSGAAAKEMQLKRLPAAWNYMRQHILPQMRQVEMSVSYVRSRVVTRRTPIPLPVVEPVVSNTYIIVDDQPDGLMIDMDELDWM